MATNKRKNSGKKTSTNSPKKRKTTASSSHHHNTPTSPSSSEADDGGQGVAAAGQPPAAIAAATNSSSNSSDGVACNSSNDSSIITHYFSQQQQQQPQSASSLLSATSGESLPVDKQWRDGKNALEESKKKARSAGGNIMSDTWKHYYISVFKNIKTKRFRAKCRYCGHELEGKNERLLSHSEICEKIPLGMKEEVLCMRTLMPRKMEQKKPGVISSAYTVEEARTDNFKSSPTISNFFDVKELPRDQAELADTLLTRALVDSGVPFSFVENWFFRRFIELIRPAYDPPSKWQLIYNLIPKEYAVCTLATGKVLSSLSDLTLSLDGWEDRRGRSIYAFLASTSQLERPYVLDIIDISHLRHTAEILKDQTVIVLDRLGLSLEKSFRAIVTDNPSTMVKMRRLLTADYPNMLDLRCFAHAVNLLASGYLRHPIAKDTLKKSCRLVSYFRSSHFWCDKLRSWAKSNKISRYLESFCETRWYSVSKVFLSVNVYEPGFRHCLQYRESNRDSPKIPRDVIDIINDRLHFGNNEACSALMTIVADTIAVIEHRKMTLGECLFNYLNLYQKTRSIRMNSLYSDLKNHCISVIKSRFDEYFVGPVYALAMFLHPKYKSLASSKEYGLKEVYEDILQFAMAWKFTKKEAKEIWQSLSEYYNGNGYFADFTCDENDPFLWWDSVKSRQPGICALKKFAMTVTKLVPHVADTERLFSVLGYHHSKSRSNLSAITLKKIGQVKGYLESIKKEEMAQAKKEEETMKGSTKKPGKKSRVSRVSLTGGDNPDVINLVENDVSINPGRVQEQEVYGPRLQGREDPPCDDSTSMAYELEQELGAADNNLPEVFAGVSSDSFSEREHRAAATMLDLWLSGLLQSQEEQEDDPVSSQAWDDLPAPTPQASPQVPKRGWKGVLSSRKSIADLFDMDHRSFSDDDTTAQEKIRDGDDKQCSDDDSVNWDVEELSNLAAATSST